MEYTFGFRSNNTFKFRHAIISTKFIKKFVSIDRSQICSEFVIVLLEPYVALEEDKMKHAGLVVNSYIYQWTCRY